jgi:hypothetical protein
MEGKEITQRTYTGSKTLANLLIRFDSHVVFPQICTHLRCITSLRLLLTFESEFVIFSLIGALYGSVPSVKFTLISLLGDHIQFIVHKRSVFIGRKLYSA